MSSLLVHEPSVDIAVFLVYFSSKLRIQFMCHLWFIICKFRFSEAASCNCVYSCIVLSRGVSSAEILFANGRKH